MRRIPRLIIELLRCNLAPKFGNKHAVRTHYYEIITVVIIEQRMDMLSWMFYRMGECRIGMGTFLVFQPYIMTLILSKAGDF